MSIKSVVPKQRYVSRVQSATSERSIELPRLNVQEYVKPVTASHVFPWDSDGLKDKRQREWPYQLQLPSKPKSLKRRNRVRDKKFQTDQKILLKKQKVKLPKIASNTTLWEPPEKELFMEAQSSPSVQSSSTSNRRINMNVLCKKVESTSRFLERNTLPKFVLKESLTTVPKWIQKNLPANISPRTIIQAGKPWHKSNECTWAIETKNIALFNRDASYFINKKSPKIDWGTSACSLQKKKFDTEYRKTKEMKKKVGKSVSIHRKSSDKDKSCKAYFFQNIIKKKVLEPITLTTDPPSRRSLSPSESVADMIPPIHLTHNLHTLSYTKKDDQKKKCTPPNISGIEKPWEYLTERTWPSNIATTRFFSTLVKPQTETPTIDTCKYPVYGQWPYVENMVKTMNGTSGTFKTKANFSFDSQLRNSLLSTRNIENFGKNKKRKSSSLIIPSVTNPIKKIEEYTYKQQNQLNELEQGIETIASTLNQQKQFPGFIETQATSMKPLRTNAPFTYKLSNLHLYELNYTYLMQKQQYLRTLIYYSKFNNKFTHDPFQIITIKRYKNKIPYLHVPSSGPATIYYPSGKEAIQCTYSTIENKPELLTRRYTIKSELTQRVEAIFDSLGNGIVYDKNGNSIFNYSQNFGVHSRSNRSYKWRWHHIPVTEEIYMEETDSLKNPPNIPNSLIEEMLLRNVNIYDRFSHTLHSETKSVKSLESIFSFPEQNPLAHKRNGEINYGVITQLKPFTVKINEYMKLYVRDQKHIELKFQANEIKLTIQIGVLLNPNIVLGRESINFNLIPYEKIVCKFDKMVGEKESLIKILKCTGDSIKLHLLKYKTQLIDFNDKVTNLIEDEPLENKLKNSSLDFQIQALSDHTLRIQNKNTKTVMEPAFQRSSNTQYSNKIKDEDNSSQLEEEKVSDFQLSKCYHLDNLLEGSNPIASNISLLINNKTKLKQFLNETKHRK